MWIEPLAYQPPLEGRVEAQLVNGQNFAGIGGAGLRLAYIPHWFNRFDLVSGDQVVPVTGRMGDTPALSMAPLAEGLNIAVYQSAGEVVTYDGWGKFETFLEHKGLQGIEAQHLARGLSQDRFAEYYTRYSKSLIGVGAGAGADRDMGLETELVALDNPYTFGGDGLHVRLTYQGAVRPDVQIELFEKSGDGKVIRTVQMTDEQGVAVLPVRSGHSYMADAVVIREPAAALAQDKGVAWESLWANLTFAVP